MAISGYMIACIVVIIFVVAAIAVLVYVIHWWRKKRKEKAVDVPTQSNRPPEERTKPNGGNANNDNFSGPRIKSMAPAITTLGPNRQRIPNYVSDENNSQTVYVNYISEPTRSRNNNDRSSSTGDRVSSSLPRLSHEAGDYVPRYRESDLSRDWQPNSDLDSHSPPPYAQFAVESHSSNHDYDEYEMGRTVGYDPRGEYETGSHYSYAAYTENEMANNRGVGGHSEYERGSNRGYAVNNVSEMRNNRGFGGHSEYERGSNRGDVADKEYEMETLHVHNPYRVSSPSRTYYNNHQGQSRPISGTTV